MRFSISKADIEDDTLTWHIVYHELMTQIPDHAKLVAMFVLKFSKPTEYIKHNAEKIYHRTSLSVSLNQTNIFPS